MRQSFPELDLSMKKPFLFMLFLLIPLNISWAKDCTWEVLVENKRTNKTRVYKPGASVVRVELEGIERLRNCSILPVDRKDDLSFVDKVSGAKRKTRLDFVNLACTTADANLMVGATAAALDGDEIDGFLFVVAEDIERQTGTYKKHFEISAHCR